MKNTRDFFDGFSVEYEEQSRGKYLFYRWLLETILNQIDKKECEILDLGTGGGELAIRLAMRFPKSSVVGSDVSSGMITLAQKKRDKIGVKNVRFVVFPMEDLNIEKADYVVSNLAFHHVKDKAGVLSKAYRILPKRGKLVIGDWFKPSREYQQQIEELRKASSKRAAEFDKSWEQVLKAMTREYREKHPKEYPVCPTNLKDLMRKIGFTKQRIVKSPLPNFAVVVGIK